MRWKRGLLSGRFRCTGIKPTLAMLAAILLIGSQVNTAPAETIEYHKEVQQGDTLWDICSEISDNQYDVGYLVWKTMRENNITKPEQIQPGMEIIVRVERRG